MKKKIIIGILCLWILTLLLFLYKETIQKNTSYELETIIQETENTVQSITKAKTKDSKLNREITKYIEEKQEEFLDFTKNNPSLYLLEREEFNIDTNIFETKEYLSVTMMTYQNGPSFSVPSNEIKTILWNTKKRRKSTIQDFLRSKDSLEPLRQEVFSLFEKECPHCLNSERFKQEFGEDSTSFFLTSTGFSFTVNPSLLQEDYHDYLIVSLPKKNPYLFYPEEKEEKEEDSQPETKKRVIDPSLPSIALTFDDGPSPYTEEILKILEENEVNATFFILGNKVTTYKEILKKSVANGNELGNHSYNHQWLSRLSTKELEKQIDQTQEILQKEIHYTPTFLRPTYGSTNRRITKNSHLEIALWTVDTKDWRIRNPDRIVLRATHNIKDFDIILMHDTYERSKDALKKIIPNLKKQGFQLVTLSELQEIKKIREYIKDASLNP